MTPDVTFMESHRSKIKQPLKYGAISHSNVLPSTVPLGESCFGKSQRKDTNNRRSSL